MVNSVHMNCLTQTLLFTSYSLITALAGRVPPGDIIQPYLCPQEEHCYQSISFCPAAALTHCKCAVWSRYPSETSTNQFSHQKKNSVNAEFLIAQFTSVISYLRDPECGYCLKPPPLAHMEAQKIDLGSKHTRKKEAHWTWLTTKFCKSEYIDNKRGCINNKRTKIPSCIIGIQQHMCLACHIYSLLVHADMFWDQFQQTCIKHSNKLLHW